MSYALPAALLAESPQHHLATATTLLTDKAIEQLVTLAHVKLLAGHPLSEPEQVLLARAARELHAYRQRKLAQNRGHRKPKRRPLR